MIHAWLPVHFFHSSFCFQPSRSTVFITCLLLSRVHDPSASQASLSACYCHHGGADKHPPKYNDLKVLGNANFCNKHKPHIGTHCSADSQCQGYNIYYKSSVTRELWQWWQWWVVSLVTRELWVVRYSWVLSLVSLVTGDPLIHHESTVKRLKT
jgi:hypothetical protein